MNAETRAKELIFALEATTSSDVITSARQRDLIIKAIVSAQNDKLEEARQRILEGHDEAWGNPAEQHGWDQAARRIESLKSKDTP